MLGLTQWLSEKENKSKLDEATTTMGELEDQGLTYTKEYQDAKNTRDSIVKDEILEIWKK